MLDLNYILENKKEVAENAKNRQIKIDLDLIEELAQKRKELIKEIEETRRRQNEISDLVVSSDKKDELMAEAKDLKQNIDNQEKELEKIAPELNLELAKIPNLTHPDSPVGKTEDDNKILKAEGSKPNFKFKPKDHLELTQKLDLIDFERGAKVAGQKFYYLKNEAVQLEFALINYALGILLKHGFTPYITPDLAQDEIIEGAGFTPRGPEAQIYYIEDSNLGLIATAEIALAGLHSQEIIPEGDLPKKLAGFSHCFRREAGTYGQASKGLYRVHQFSKVEMFVYSLPEDSDRMLKIILNVEEKIFKGLGIPYRVMDCCTAELGGPAYRKFDLEAWFPGEGRFGEITSASNCTDYQARRLGIKVKRNSPAGGGKTEYLHMLNGTAIAISRALIAILENYQKEDGSVAIPKILHKWLSFKEIHPVK